MNKTILNKSSLQNVLFNISKKNLGKTFRPTKYNLRLYYSNLNANIHSYGRWETVWGPNGLESTQTDRNPNNFKYRTNLWGHTLYELRHIYGDIIYQIIRRKHRLGDNYMKYVHPSLTVAFYLLSGHHFAFFVSLYYILILLLIIGWFLVYSNLWNHKGHG
jgi:hypothetical protein